FSINIIYIVNPTIAIPINIKIIPMLLLNPKFSLRWKYDTAATNIKELANVGYTIESGACFNAYK
ncbi:MAG: hypothetical protein QXS03_03155, partial [Candidatus Micrarchaeaceae archaeon]